MDPNARRLRLVLMAFLSCEWNATKAAAWLPGQVQVFIHGEAQAVMHNLRPYVRKERGVDAKWASISGYWRRGRSEETFRLWKAELAAAEAAQAD
jgi:hypothetical protein